VTEIARLRAALGAAKGYMLNAKIDLQTGTPKRTTLATLEGGSKMVDEALAAPALQPAPHEEQDR